MVQFINTGRLIIKEVGRHQTLMALVPVVARPTCSQVLKHQMLLAWLSYAPFPIEFVMSYSCSSFSGHASRALTRRTLFSDAE